MDTERYKALMDAAKLIASACAALNREDGQATSPAWTMAFHAQRYCENQAAQVFRSEEHAQALENTLEYFDRYVAGDTV